MDSLISGIKHNWHFAFFSILALLLLFTALSAPWIAPYHPETAEMKNAFLPPSDGHWFGTDKLVEIVFPALFTEHVILCPVF